MKAKQTKEIQVKKICLYCSLEKPKLSREGICKECKNLNDEQIEDNRFECDFCGRMIYEDDSYFTTDDKVGCENCVSYCASCDGYHRNDNIEECGDCGEYSCSVYKCKDKNCNNTICDCCKSGNGYCESCNKKIEQKQLEELEKLKKAEEEKKKNDTDNKAK